MRAHFKILLLLIFFGNEISAQIFPVQGSATLIPPYATRLSDYVTSTTERFVLNALLTDATKAELHVRFKLSIVGQNVKLETKPEYIGTPIALQGGVPLRLTNVELAEYFDVNHLNFSGISKSEFLKTGFLPEGFYQFCFEVYEYGRSVKISNTICAPAWLVLNDPPLVNLPRNGEKLRPLNAQAQNVIMQWTPRHTGSPNSAFTTEYEIKVVEVWPANRNPNDAILTQPPIFETTTHSTTFIFGPDATQLELGRTYAFRVQARAMAGAEQLDLFKNNGFSETVAFIYGDACEAPVNILPKVDPTRLWLRWDTGPSQTEYVVRHRMKGQDDEHWYPTRTLVQELRINDLEPNTTYEYQIMSTCGSFESGYSGIAVVTTPPPPPKLYECGKPMEKIDLTPTQIVPTLSAGDVVKAADFDVTITKASGSNGKFSGEGTVRIPFFNNAKARVKFNNITVAKVASGDKRMVEGHMDVVGPEVVPKGISNAMDKLSQAMKVADSVLNLTRQSLTGKPIPDNFVADEVVKIPSGIKTATYDVATGKIILIDNSGKQQSLSPDKNYAITDGTGGGVIVAKNGGVVKVSSEEMGKILNRKYDLNLAFANTTDSRYGIDLQKVDALKKNYEQLKEGYFVAYKAVATGSSDEVLATLISRNMDSEKIKFDQDNAAVGAETTGDRISLKATAKTKGDNPPIIARIIDEKTKAETIVGKLSVVGYNQENLKLHIVPVNGTTLTTGATEIEKQLNGIYNPAVINWSVSMDSSLKVDGLASPFDNGSSGVLSTYTADMKAVINTYLDNTKLEDNNYYLFLVPKGTNTTENGYMPRSKQCGFVFLDGDEKDATQIVRTMAHELGHGAFTLQHTFSDYPALAQGSTDNLMDYGSGTTLLKYQWDVIHNPRIVLGVFESDEAGASVSVPCLGLFDDCNDVVAMLKAIKAKVAASSKYTINYPNLPIFKPDASKNRKSLYQGSYLGIDAVDYNQISIINETAKDETIDPKIYYDYIEREQGKFSAGFLFKLSDNSVFKIMVSNEKDSITAKSRVVSLRKYLFGTTPPQKILSKIMEDPGTARSRIAKEIMDQDERVYRQETDLAKKISDDFVDCAEFVHEVVEKWGNFDIGWYCGGQYDWFEARGETGSSWTDAKVGDVVFWVVPGDETLVHEGVIYELKVDGTATMIHSSCRGSCDGTATKESISTSTTNSGGDLWADDAGNRRNFKYWARKK